MNKASKSFLNIIFMWIYKYKDFNMCNLFNYLHILLSVFCEPLLVQKMLVQIKKLYKAV